MKTLAQLPPRSIPAIAATLLLVACSAAAQSTTPAAQTDPLAVNRQIDEQIAKLQTMPGAKEVFDLQKRIDALDSKSTQEKQPLIEQMRTLQDSDAYKEYVKQANQLYEKRVEDWQILAHQMAEAAKQIYASRHAEIAKFAPGELPAARALGFDVLTYPRLDGSTSTQPLAVILASRILNVPYEWSYPEPTGTRWVERAPLAADSVGPFGRDPWDNRNMEFMIAASRVQATGTDQRSHRVAAMINSLLAANTDTHAAYENLINGTCDVNLTARPPSADESKLAQEKKVELELVPIAVDALVFITYQSNPVKSLTLDQIKQIFQFQVRIWLEVGVTGGEIHPFFRESNSGSRELFDALVVKTPPNVSTEMYAQSMAGPYNRVTQDPSGIGYSVYYYEHFMALSPYTHTLAINGIEPNPDTLASGKYPLIAPVYAAIRKSDPATSPGRKLVAYLTSPEGKQLIRESGYVPSK